MKPDNVDKLADSIVKLIYRILNRPDAPVANVYLYIWQNQNAMDPNLSDLTDLKGNPIIGVAQLNTGVTFHQGDPVICIRGRSVPLTMLGQLIGDITAVIT